MQKKGKYITSMHLPETTVRRNQAIPYGEHEEKEENKSSRSEIVPGWKGSANDALHQKSGLTQAAGKFYARPKF